MNKIYYKDIPYKVGGDSTLVEATITERGETSASDFRADGFSKVNVNVPYTDVHYAKDDIVSFEGEDFPLKSLTAYITALQDLHGYYYPWVGGSGRNLFNMGSKVDGTIANITYTSDDEYLYMNGTKQGGGYADLTVLQLTLPTGTYYLKAITISGTASNSVELYPYDGSGNLTSSIINTERTLTLEAEKTFRFRFAIWTDGTVLNNYKLGIVISKTANIDKFYPYSNICPIIGWSAVDVNVSGVNVWDEEWEIGGLNPLNGETTSETDRIRSKNYRPCKPNMTMFYYIPSGKGNLQIVFYDINKNYLSYYNFTTEHTFTTPNGCYFFKFNTGGSYGTTYNNDISINYPSTDTSYHAYNGNTYSLTFTDGSNPLTVYGGKLDVVSGVLTVDKGYVDLGTLDWQYSSISERFYVGASDLGVKATDASTPFNAISSALIAKSYNEIEAKTVDYAIGINPNATQLFARYSSITSASDFITAMNGVQLVYELATPLTYQLSKQQIKSLVGENNIFADTGEVAVEWQTLYQTP